jgi:hypothetical protein
MLEYRRHEEAQKPRMRLRQSNWWPDQFEVVDYDDFQAFKAMCEKLSLPLRDLDYEDMCNEEARIAERKAYGRGDA